jgi:hypothetical protein
MTSLATAVSNAEQQFTVNTVGLVSSGLSNAVAAAQNAATAALSGAANAAVASVNGAVGSLLAGNVSGAVSSISNAASNIGSSFLAGLGSSSSSANLSSPGSFSSTSSIGGVDPGNALPGALARSDPMLSFTWYAQLPVINPGSTQTPSSASSAQGLLGSLASSLVSGALSSAMGGAISTSNSAQLPWYYVEEATMPFRQFTSKAIFREGRDRNYPEKYSVDTLRLAIYADSQNQSFQYLQAWNNTLLAPFSAATASQSAGGWGRPSDYKQSIYIYLLDVTKNILAIVQYTECWPMTIEPYAMNSASSERIMNHVTFSVGDVFINLMGVSPNITASVLANAGSNLLTQAISGASNAIQNLSLPSISQGISSVSDSISSLL